MSTAKTREELEPYEGPIWITVENPEIVGFMVSYEADEKEPGIELNIRGKGLLDNHAAIYDLNGGASDYLVVSISQCDYHDIKERRRKLIEQDGDTGFTFCADKEATLVYIHHMEAEHSDVGKLWNTSWALNIQVPKAMFSELIDSFRFDGVGKVNLGVDLKNVLHDGDERDIYREESNLFIESEKQPHGFMNELSISPAQQSEEVAQKEAGRWKYWVTALIFVLVVIGLANR